MARIFISYSTKDRVVKDRLVAHLTPYVTLDHLDAWNSDEITAGSDFDAEIKQQMARAQGAILLLSAHFMASNYIQQVELPALKARGIPLYPLIIEPCSWNEDPLLRTLLVRPEPHTPLLARTPEAQEEILLAFAREIHAQHSIAPRKLRLVQALVPALLVLVIALLAWRLWPKPPGSYQFAVRLQGEKPGLDFLSELSQLRAITTIEPYRADVDSDGMAYFRGLPTTLAGQKMKFSAEGGKTWCLASPDSAFTIANNSTVVLHLVRCNLGLAYGEVRNRAGLLLEGVLVSGPGCQDTTDFKGQFTLEIPRKRWQPEVIISFYKKGYNPATATIYPQLPATSRIVLEEQNPKTGNDYEKTVMVLYVYFGAVSFFGTTLLQPSR